MAPPGPQPKPTQIKIAQGNPGRRQLNDGEPVPPPGPVDAPKWLTPAARAIWDDLAPVLITMRVLTVADRMTFGRYCRAFARYLELQKNFWDKGPHGTLYPLKDKKGRTRNAGEWPQAAEIRRLQEILVRLEDRFGLSPAARSRLRVSGSGNAGTPPPDPTKDTGPLRMADYVRQGGPKPPRPSPSLPAS